MTGIEVYTITASDLLVTFVAVLLLMVVTFAITLWVAGPYRQPESGQSGEPDAFEVVDAAMVRSRRRRHHVPAHPRPLAYQPGRAQVYEGPTGPTVDLTEARSAVRR